LYPSQKVILLERTGIGVESDADFLVVVMGEIDYFMDLIVSQFGFVRSPAPPEWPDIDSVRALLDGGKAHLLGT
jgi:hypothetical protein